MNLKLPQVYSWPIFEKWRHWLTNFALEDNGIWHRGVGRLVLFSPLSCGIYLRVSVLQNQIRPCASLCPRVSKVNLLFETWSMFPTMWPPEHLPKLPQNHKNTDRGERLHTWPSVRVREVSTHKCFVHHGVQVNAIWLNRTELQE